VCSFFIFAPPSDYAAPPIEASNDAISGLPLCMQKEQGPHRQVVLELAARQRAGAAPAPNA
jgi:hypothetical protein